MSEEVTGKRYVTTLNRDLAIKLGFIGEVLVLPNFLAACIRIHLDQELTRPLHFFYCGHPDARLKKKFGIETEVNAYE